MRHHGAHSEDRNLPVERSTAQALHQDRKELLARQRQRLLLVAALFPLQQVAALQQAALQARLLRTQVVLQSSAATSEQAEFERVQPKIKVRSRHNYRR